MLDWLLLCPLLFPASWHTHARAGWQQIFILRVFKLFSFPSIWASKVQGRTFVISWQVGHTFWTEYKHNSYLEQWTWLQTWCWNYWSGFGAKASPNKTKRWSTRDWLARTASTCQNAATLILISDMYVQSITCAVALMQIFNKTHTSDTFWCCRCCNRTSIAHAYNRSRHAQFRTPCGKTKTELHLTTHHHNNTRRCREQKRTQQKPIQHCAYILDQSYFTLVTAST